MTRDFKTNDIASTTTNQYGISWVLGGIAVGLIAGAAVYAMASKGQINLDFNSVVATPQIQTETVQTPATPSSTTGSSTSTPPPEKTSNNDRPGFTYYAVLPQLELDVNEQIKTEVAVAESTPTTQAEPPRSPRPEALATTTRPRAPLAAGGRIMLQLGSYKTQAQAVQLQRHVSQNGLNTRVETATIRGETWYRVRLGPTDDINVVNRWKQMLTGMGISPMIIRL
ncbi:MAG: hypothetical protein CR991_10940 [Proteobacteria bacterium]|nr:MAG: hypothetical protein CR991_10940 [Pseudomonadota bacterium]